MNWNRLSNIKTKASLTRWLQRYYEGSLEAFFVELNRESDRLIRTDLNKALLLSEKTAGLERILPDHYRAHLYRIWARHQHLSSHYPAAGKLYLKAMALFETLGDRNSQAKVRKALLDVLMYLGRYDEGIDAGRRALRHYRKIGSEIDAAQVMTNLGNLYHRLDQNLKALDYYDRAMEIFRRLDNDYAMALVQFNRGNVLANLNNLNEAEKMYRQAGEIYRKLGMDLSAGQVDYSLAYTAFLKGAHSESLEAFSRAASEFRRLGDRRCLALTELDLMEVNLHLNLYSQAIGDAMNVAEEFRHLNMSYERGKAFYFAASGYFVFGDYDLAAKLARQSLALFKKENNEPWQMMCRFLTARIDSREGRTVAALKSLRAIANFYHRLGDVRHYFDVRLVWLETLISSGDYAAAARMIAGMGRVGGRMAGFQKFIYYMLIGDMHRARSNPTQAAVSYRRAVRLAEKLRAAIFPDEIRRFFWMDKLAAYNRLAAIYLEAGQNRRAFSILEEGKAAAMLTTEGRSEGIARRDIPPQLEEERLRLKAYLRKAVTPVGISDRSAVAVGNVSAAEHRLWKIERELRRQGLTPDFGEAAGPVEIEAIRSKLKSGEALLRYVCHDNNFGVFIIDHEKFEYRVIEADIDEIRGLLARFYFLINRIGADNDDQSVLSRIIESISAHVWGPLADRLADIRRVFIIPDGILTRLPFYILNAGDGQALFEKYDIYLHSNTADFMRHDFSDRDENRFDSVAIIAASDDDMPGAALESLAVARHFKQSKVFSGDQADSRNLLDSLKEENGLVHLIAHAAQSYENHLFSRILLSDGPLYPFDLIARPIRSHLVVLSGCQTGDPGLYYYNDSLSLAQTVLMAGAGRVIASHWPVADVVTCRFMDAFYRYLSKEGNIYRALRQAMLEMKSHSGDIRHWASFYLACG